MKSLRSIVTIAMSLPLSAALVSACGDDDDHGGSKSTGGSTFTGGATSTGGGVSDPDSPGSGGKFASAGSGAGGATHTGGGGTGGARASGGSTGGARASGGRAGACGITECLRAVVCVARCGGPVVSNGCCPCESGTIDELTCSGPGAGGAANEGGAGGHSNPLDELNTPCVDGTCSAGLTPVKFYGVAGEAGPEFCWCTIPCESGVSSCPAGSKCTTVSDGPGNVCYVID